MKEGGITRQYSLEVSKEIMRRSATRPWQFYESFLGAQPSVFTWYVIDKVAPEAVKEGYTFTKILAQGREANEFYDLYSIPSLLMSLCMFWGMSLK